MKYSRYVIFFFLGIVENTINFVFSLFNMYPMVDLQYKYWDSALKNASMKSFMGSIKKNG
jgi:hypothetical protein